MDRSRHMTRKPDDDGEEEEGKPTLNRKASNIPSRVQRILEALQKLSDDRLQKLTTQIGPDELAVAVQDADEGLKSKLASFLPPDKLEVYKEYLALDRAKLPKDVVDGVQGKLLRLAH
jgi:flagellar FliG-like protein